MIDKRALDNISSQDINVINGRFLYIMMTVLMLIGTLICNQGAAISYKSLSTISTGKQHIAPVFMAFWTGILSLLLIIAVYTITGDFRLSSITIITGIIGGICFATSGILFIYIMATGPFIWSVLMINLSSFIPVLFSLVFLDESISIPQITGVLIIVSILIIMSVGLKSDNRPFTSKWMVLAVFVMLTNGAILCAQKVQSYSMAGTETVEMLSVMFLFTSVCACIYSTFLLIGKNKEKVKFKVILPPAFGLVGTLGIGNILSITLMGRISAAIQFPLIVGGGIVISGILGVFLYKEQPGWRLYLSIVLLLLGVILIGF